MAPAQAMVHFDTSLAASPAAPGKMIQHQQQQQQQFKLSKLTLSPTKVKTGGSTGSGPVLTVAQRDALIEDLKVEGKSTSLFLFFFPVKVIC